MNLKITIWSLGDGLITFTDRVSRIKNFTEHDKQKIIVMLEAAVSVLKAFILWGFFDTGLLLFLRSKAQYLKEKSFQILKFATLSFLHMK